MSEIKNVSAASHQMFAVEPTQRCLNVSSELVEGQSQQETGLSSSCVSG